MNRVTQPSRLRVRAAFRRAKKHGAGRPENSQAGTPALQLQPRFRVQFRLFLTIRTHGAKLFQVSRERHANFADNFIRLNLALSLLSWSQMCRRFQIFPWQRFLAASLVMSAMIVSRAPPANAATREFPPGSLNRPEELPSGRFRNELIQLPEAARERALAVLRGFHFTELDLSSLHVDSQGGVLYADEFVLSPAPAIEPSPPQVAKTAVPVSPFPTHLVFHSRPGAVNILYLNFTGENVSNTAWNTSLGRTVIPAVAFSTDGDYSTFSDAEQLAIKRIWQRVAEDYAPFNIDVTTQRPGTFTTRTAHALITRNTDANGSLNPADTAGGVSYVNVFATSSYATYRPSWIYFNNLAYDESYIAEAASHEIGHNMGLSHDGRTDGYEYYGGHGSGDISWGPLMGTGYNRNVSQWSKGEYYLANNTQDDLATIAAKISYRTDDHGNTAGTATPLTITGGTNVVSTTPEDDPANTNTANKGVLERTLDVDVFSFVTGNGPISFNVSPWIMPSGITRGGNLDVRLELYNQAGALLLTNNPTSQTIATIQTTLAEGNYYLYVRNTGVGDPFSSTPSGYTVYGSIGQYFISGYVQPSSGFVVPPVAEVQATDITQPGIGAKQFTVTYSDNLGVDVSTIDSQDIRIAGPNGYDRPGQFVSVDISSDGTPRVATYATDPPAGGIWTGSDNGTYTIWMRTNQVGDTEGAWVTAGQLGQFSVKVPTPLYAANMNANPGWTLEPQWQYGQPSYPGGGPTGGFTGANIIAYNLSGNYANNLSAKYATTPAINCSGVSSVTLRFHRWLRLKNNDTALIQVSTNGTAWADVWSAPGSVSDNSWQEIQYALPVWVAGSPTVQLRWGIASGPSQNDIGWNIDDVELLGGGILDVTPPVASLSVADITIGGSPSHSFSVTYTDDSAVRVASLGIGDAYVTGPNGYSNLVDFVGVDLPTDGTPRTATYSIPAPGGAWDAADNGTYQIVLIDGEVEDTFNNPVPQTAAGAFSVAIPISQQALVVNPTALTVTEGSNATFTVRLAEQPASTVTVSVVRVGGDADLFVQSGATNQFTLLNWATPVPVAIAALSDPDLSAGSAFFECRAAGLATVTVVATEQDTTPGAVLTVTVNNPAWGSATPTNGTYAQGWLVQVLATPANYFQFANWTGDTSASNNPITVMLNTNITLQANFGEIFTTNHPTPLWWLASHGYTNDFETVVTNVGPNGMALWQSYIAGLNPNDPSSQLRLNLDVSANAAERVLQWNTVSGRVYSVWCSTNLLTGFAPLSGATNLPWTVQTITNAVEPALASAFYRLEVRKP